MRVGAMAQGADRRRHPRYTVDEAAHLLLVDHGLDLECRVLDMSLEGCRLHAEEDLPEVFHVRVEVTFQINGIPFRLGGTIRRVTAAQDLGISFVEMSARRHAEWAEVLAEVQSQHHEHDKHLRVLR